MLRGHCEAVWAYSTVDMIAFVGVTTVSLHRDTFHGSGHTPESSQQENVVVSIWVTFQN